MRLLVNRSVFRETHYGSDVFANNRLSSVFLSVHEKNLRGVTSRWFVRISVVDGTLLTQTWLFRADDAYKAGVYTVDSVKLTSEGKSPFELEHGMTVWEWLETPESALSHDRINKTMMGFEGVMQGALVYDHDWEKHGQGATIVDVGGGVGGGSIGLARRFPKIRIVLQDQPSVIEAAPKVRNPLTHHPFEVYLGTRYFAYTHTFSSPWSRNTVLGRKRARMPV